MGRWQSGQMQRTVNPSSKGYAGSNPALPKFGVVAQLARAPALHAGGQEFESPRLHFVIIDNLFAPIAQLDRAAAF